LERVILDGIDGTSNFERAHLELGRMLGFDVGKIETDASPDPWWTCSGICFVFEDHAGSENDIVSATKARQVASHPAWVRTNMPEIAGGIIAPVLVTPASRAQRGAIPSLTDVLLWRLDDFRIWAKAALVTVRELRSSCPSEADLDWRARAIDLLQARQLDAHSLYGLLVRTKASTLSVVG